eukprot:12378608-Alexandrium_andersonii.AAC.1
MQTLSRRSKLELHRAPKLWTGGCALRLFFAPMPNPLTKRAGGRAGGASWGVSVCAEPCSVGHLHRSSESKKHKFTTLESIFQATSENANFLQAFET